MGEKSMDIGHLLEISGYYWKTCTLHAGVKLDLFTHLGAEELTGEEIAEKLKADARAVQMLANALTAMGLLRKKGSLYANTPFSFAHLNQNEPNYMGYIILHHHQLMDSWNHLEKAVRQGGPIRGRLSQDNNEESRKNFLMGMFNLAMNLAPRVVKAVDLSNRRHLLDLGGGPGTYAIHFCKEYPQMKATVFDLPTTEPFARETIDRFAMAERVNFVGGDFLEQELPKGYDVAWLSHILHGEGPEDCQAMVNKAAFGLERGGLLLIHEFILEDSCDAPLFAALFSLNMLLGTEKGQSYTEGQLKDMLSRAGLSEIRRLPFQGPNESGIIQGVKP